VKERGQALEGKVLSQALAAGAERAARRDRQEGPLPARAFARLTRGSVRDRPASSRASCWSRARVGAARRARRRPAPACGADPARRSKTRSGRVVRRDRRRRRGPPLSLRRRRPYRRRRDARGARAPLPLRPLECDACEESSCSTST
jgi:hypothetical protein